MNVPEAPPQRHPRGLYTLFFTEMWERLSYYGMRAILILFMVDQIQSGGLGLTDRTATAIYGLYTAGVYLATLPGGWMADRLLGAQRAVWYGGILIAAGHFTLAIPRQEAFFMGLMLVVLGTGLLKPNVSTMVGSLYPEGGDRRDAGFTIFYMGINIGAALGPILCGTLGEKVNWHYGFAAAGIGMIAGLVQYRFTRHYLGEAGLHAPHGDGSRRTDWTLAGTALGLLVVVIVLALGGWIRIDPHWLAQRSAVVIACTAGAYFVWAFLFAGLDETEKRRMAVIVVLFLASAMFWSGFEQAGSSLNLFADRYTDRVIDRFQFEIPASWFQSLNAVFVITFAPVAAVLWVTLARRNRSVSLPAKFAIGLLLLAAGFLVLVFGAKRSLEAGPVLPTWLILTYLLHTWGELALSPVGLSSVTKLAPKRLVGQMMGIWFVSASLGNLIAGLIAGEVTAENASAMPARFLQVVGISGGLGLVLLAFSKPIMRLMAGVR